MVENPFFSVLISVYNVEFFLERALLSVLNQSFSNFEIIAVNDGSTDHSSDILNRFSEKDHRLNVIHQYNQGFTPIALCLLQSLISTRQVFYRYRIRNNSIMTSQSSLENVRGALKAVSNLLQLRKTIANSDTKKALLHRIRTLVKETSNRLDSISTNSYTHLHHFLMFISIRHIPLLGGKLIF